MEKDMLQNVIAMRLVNIYSKINTACIIDIDNLSISGTETNIQFDRISQLNNWLLNEIELSVENMI